MTIIKWIFGTLCLVMLGSCIKENRGECPCFLSVDFSSIDTAKVEFIHMWFADAHNGIIRSDTLSSNNFPDFYEIEVPKGSTYIYCWGNIHSSNLINSVLPSITTSTGAESNRLYFYKGTIDSSEEFARDTVHMKREYMKLNIKIIGNVISSSGFSISIESSSMGYFITGDILEGYLKLSPDPIITPMAVEDYFEYTFNIIRQKNMEELRLNMISTENGKDKLIYGFPLGEALTQMGIDMKADELGDVSITIDFSQLNPKIIIENWDGTKKIEVII